MAVKITFTIQEPQKLIKADLHPGMFNDDLTFAFEARDFHTTDAKEVAAVFADLDVAVLKVKEAWDRSH